MTKIKRGRKSKKDYDKALDKPKSAPACSSKPQSSPKVESKRPGDKNLTPVDIKLTIRWAICSICVLKYTEAFLFSFLLKYDF